MRTLGVRGGDGRGGFSLIEVLIGVLVLSLALLGLAALFPVVVREQRLARETILGVTAQKSAEAFLQTHLQLNPISPNSRSGWQGLSLGLSGRADARLWSSTIRPIGGSVDAFSFYDNDNNGNITIRGAAPAPTIITPRERMTPTPQTGARGLQPVLVWDIAACRVERASLPEPPFGGGGQVGGIDGNAIGRGALRVAMFVRRIDPAIRVPAGQTLSDVLLGSGNVRATAVAGNPPLPTNNGIGFYARPLTLDVDDAVSTRNNGPVNVLVFRSAEPAYKLQLAAQVGQKLVDNLGNVYTVVGEGKDARNRPVARSVQVDPPLLPDAVLDARGEENGRPLLQVVFTPQVPAYVTVFDIRQ